MHFRKSIFILSIVIVILAGTLAGLLVYGKRMANTTMENNQEYHVAPRDADAYFSSNATVISVVNAKDSKEVLSEAETHALLTGRGFTTFPITYEYSMKGSYSEATEVQSSSSKKHPSYQTYHITQAGDVWTIFVVNGSVMANPASYNMQTEQPVQVILSETDTITSYNGTANKFYETIPNASALVVKTVERIDIQTLEQLTYGAIDAL